MSASVRHLAAGGIRRGLTTPRLPRGRRRPTSAGSPKPLSRKASVAAGATPSQGRHRRDSHRGSPESATGHPCAEGAAVACADVTSSSGQDTSKSSRSEACELARKTSHLASRLHPWPPRSADPSDLGDHVPRPTPQAIVPHTYEVSRWRPGVSPGPAGRGAATSPAGRRSRRRPGHGTRESMTSSESPSSRNGVDHPSAARRTQHSAASCSPNRETPWSIPPVGAPATSVSARTHTLTSSARRAGVASSPRSADSQSATADPSAAELESRPQKAPCCNKTSTPGRRTPRLALPTGPQHVGRPAGEPPRTQLRRGTLVAIWHPGARRSEPGRPRRPIAAYVAWGRATGRQRPRL